ncbi:MAG: ergothioneine biosynthesis protein EgtB [Chloroflexota bacterium]|nr:ergothioneine biosynthesis protein EgtB [Chloroflexota bacterium]MDE2969484.1 ergothioneine biosynthesis protein EgtB [Chloroflexota bacterium]
MAESASRESRREAASSLAERYRWVRQWTEELCAPLSPEDCVIQSMPDASPARWHLAHTTWFFETFICKPFIPDYRPYHELYEYLFNSYYNAVGAQYPRPERGLLSRPTVREVYQYRSYVDHAVLDHIETAAPEQLAAMEGTLVLGFNHEQQHQELILTDLKHMLSHNPLAPVYTLVGASASKSAAPALRWTGVPGGVHSIGFDGGGFHFDCEGPRHRTLLQDAEIASRLVTNGEWLDFMRDGGYARSDLWLSDGWRTVREQGWQAPLYWVERDGAWVQFTLHGMVPIDPAEPVCHVSHYEADAFARWAGARLPTEAEWEVAAAGLPTEGNLAESRAFHPAPAPPANGGMSQAFGDVWEWTQSAYLPYPGFRAEPGAIGEYNGKFMSGQMVLRGGSCVTPASHIRATYRNFFPPSARWQFTGLRLARDA